jgi:predicted amidohydrolase
VAEIDPAQSAAARAKIPNLKNAREFTLADGAGRIIERAEA